MQPFKLLIFPNFLLELISSSQIQYEAGTGLIPIWQLEKLRHKEMSHSWAWDSDPDNLVPEMKPLEPFYIRFPLCPPPLSQSEFRKVIDLPKVAELRHVRANCGTQVCLFRAAVCGVQVQFSCSVVFDSLTPWTAACQTSLSITNSWTLLKLMSIKSVMPSSHLITIIPF